jgi:hypothetical protein
MTTSPTTTSLDGDVTAPPVRPIPLGLVAAVGGGLLLAVTNALVGFGTPPAETAADVVEAVAARPLLSEIIGGVGLLAVLLLVPGIWAVATALAVRTPRLAAIGGWAMGSGYVLATSLSTETLTTLAVASTGLDPAAYVAALDSVPLTTTLMYAVFGVGALGGGLVLGIAMLRQGGAVPTVAGWLLVASEPVRVLGLVLGLPVGPPLASVLIAVAFGLTLRSLRDERPA